jgi:hypothetical protein
MDRSTSVDGIITSWIWLIPVEIALIPLSSPGGHVNRLVAINHHDSDQHKNSSARLLLFREPHPPCRRDEPMPADVLQGRELLWAGVGFSSRDPAEPT